MTVAFCTFPVSAGVPPAAFAVPPNALQPRPARLKASLRLDYAQIRSHGIKGTAHAQAGVLRMQQMSLPLRSLAGKGEGRGEVRVIPTKHQKPIDPLQIRLLRASRQPVKPHHLPALVHELELGIGRQPFQWRPCRALAQRRQACRAVAPLQREGGWDVHQP